MLTTARLLPRLVVGWYVQVVFLMHVYIHSKYMLHLWLTARASTMTKHYFINPRCACAARVTVVGFACVSVKGTSHLPCQLGKKIVGFSLKVEIQHSLRCTVICTCSHFSPRALYLKRVLTRSYVPKVCFYTWLCMWTLAFLNLNFSQTFSFHWMLSCFMHSYSQRLLSCKHV